MNPGRWRHIAESYADIGMLPKDFPLEGFLYNQDFKFNTSLVYRSLAFALLLIAIIGSVAYYIYRINRELARSINTPKLAEQRELLRSNVLELLANGAPLSTILEDIVRGVEQANPAMLCSILLLDHQGKHLLTGAAPSLPEFFITALQRDRNWYRCGFLRNRSLYWPARDC